MFFVLHLILTNQVPFSIFREVTQVPAFVVLKLQIQLFWKTEVELHLILGKGSN